MRIWMMIFMSIVVLTGCQGVPTQVTATDAIPAEATEVMTEGGSEEAVEPRWTKFVEYMVDEYLHHLPEGAYGVAPALLLEEMNKGSEMTVLDLRSSETYGAGHLKGAVSAPFGLDLYHQLANIKLDQPVYVYCATGQLSGQAHVMLRLLGFESYVVTLGFDYGIAPLAESAQMITVDQSLLDEGKNQLDEDILSEVQAYLSGLEGAKEKGYENYLLSPTTLNEWLLGSKEMTVISVQSHEAYEKAKIKGALNLPFDGHFAHDLLEMDVKPLVVVYDEEGQNGSQAVTALRLLGYEAYSLDGGLGTPQNAPLGWTNGGFGIEQ
jgi:rhodanese-related sulfurtransferase